MTLIEFIQSKGWHYKSGVLGRRWWRDDFPPEHNTLTTSQVIDELLSEEVKSCEK